MPNTIQLKLLENKSIVAEVNGRNYAYEGGYNIVAGEVNATEFEIASVPAQYEGADISLKMTNALKKPVLPPEIKDNKFTLPIGMAIAGYGQIDITLSKDGETVPFLPLRIKVANTSPNWQSDVIEAKISIGGVVTLPPESDATVTNIGTDNNAILVFGIPEGKGFVVDITYPSVAAMNAGYETDGVRLYGFALIDTGNVEDEDNAKLYIKGLTKYKYLTDLSGAQGIKGETGTGISSIVADGTDASGGNIYKITLTNGQTAIFTAPKGAKGNPGSDGVGISTVTSGASSVVGDYTETPITVTKTDGTSSTIKVQAKNGKDGEGFNESGTYQNMTVGSAGEATKLSTSKTIDGVFFNGTNNICHAGICSTASETSIKDIVLPLGTSFQLIDGARIAVKFTTPNTVSSPRLRVGSTTSYVHCKGRSSDIVWKAEIIEFILFDGFWEIVGGYSLADKPVGKREIQHFGEDKPANIYGGTWTVDNDYAGRTSVYYGLTNNASFDYKGTYSSSTQYTKNQIVYYLNKYYVAIRDTKGNEPSNTTYWSIYQNGTTGGEGIISLSTENLPQNIGTFQALGWEGSIGTTGIFTSTHTFKDRTAPSGNVMGTEKITMSGEGKPFYTIQPYITETMWKRIA